jgi:hypothetical protein
VADTKATVTLSLVDLTQDRIKSLRQDIEALSKVRTASAVDNAGRESGLALTKQSQALKDAERGWHGVNSEASKAKETISGLTSAMTGFGRSAVGGAGLGSMGSLLTAGGIGAVVAAAGVIAGQSVKMAYEFDKAATHAAQALSIGTGSSLSGNIAALKTASAQGLAYNISRPETLAAIQAYGAASGTGVRAATGAAGGMAMYARAYAMDPQQVAQVVGTVTAMTGKDFDQEAGGMFGAAESAGNLGRRLPEFLSTVTQTLTQLQASNAKGNFTGSEAAALIADVAHGQKGFYGTSAGAEAFFGSGKSLMAGISSSQKGLAFGVAAGIPQLDLMLERGGPKNEELLMQQVGRYAQMGNGGTEADVINVMRAQGVSPDTIRQTLDRYSFDKNGRLQGKSWQQQTHGFYSTQAPLSAHDEAALAKKRADEYKATPLGQTEALFVAIQNQELKTGETLLTDLQKAAGWFDKTINGDFTRAAYVLGGALALNTAAQLGLNPLKLLGRGVGLGRGIAGVGEVAAGAEGAAGAEAAGGVGAGLLGIGAAPLVAGAALAGAAWTGFYHLVGGKRMGEAHDIGALAAGGLTDDASRSLIMGGTGGSRSLFSASQNASLRAASNKYGVPMALLAGLALQEHGGAVSNRDQIGGGGRGWFQIDTGSHMDWLRTHNMGHDFGSAADYAAAMVADTWKSTHSLSAVGEFYNGGHVGAKTTVNDRGTYEQGLATATNQAFADGVGSTNIPDGNGGTVAVVVKATHHPARKLATQSVIKTRA